MKSKLRKFFIISCICLAIFSGWRIFYLKYFRYTGITIQSIVDNSDIIATIVKKLSGGAYDKMARPENTSPEYILTLYQMMKDIHDVCEHVKIDYWISFGTLLGAVRHEGIIPWDDDLDISIHEKDSDRFRKEAMPILQKMGYEVRDEPEEPVFKVVASKEMYASKKKGKERPICDVFVCFEKEGKLKPNVWPQGMPIRDLYPIKKYKFGSFYVYGPATPEPYLNDCYGKNWKDIAYKGSDHANHTDTIRPFGLKNNDFQPALPIGPLKENLKLLLGKH